MYLYVCTFVLFAMDLNKQMLNLLTFFYRLLLHTMSPFILSFYIMFCKCV